MVKNEHDHGRGGLNTEEMKKVVLRLQVGAVARVIFLMGEGTTIDNVTAALAEAEKAANFMCGFVMLDGDTEAKEAIVNEMLTKGYASLDEDGAIKLTDAGKKLSQVLLPAQIEEKLS